MGQRDQLRGLRLVEVSLRFGEDHAQRHDNGEDKEDRDREEQKDIKEKIHREAMLWVEPFASWLPARRAYNSERAYRARFTVMIRNIWDAMCRQMAFNLFRGSRLIVET